MKNNGKTSRAEFRAIIAIAVILILTISFPSIRDLLRPTPANSESALTLSTYHFNDTSGMSDPASELHRRSYPSGQKNQYTKQTIRSYDAQASYAKDKGTSLPRDRQSIIACRAFDPNTVSKNDLGDMGVNNYVINNLLKYRESGAIFRKAEDLQKIYGMDSILFSELVSCIHIQSDVAGSAQSRRNVHVDINRAGIEEWQELPGIGEVLASRIVKYREYLGGFHAIQQVGETYGLPPETLQQIIPRLVIESGPRKLDLNTATSEQLSAHPYITQRQAEAIVNFRNHHGSFTQIQDVLKIYCLNDDWFMRMQPYLACFTEVETAETLAAR